MVRLAEQVDGAGEPAGRGRQGQEGADSGFGAGGTDHADGVALRGAALRHSRGGAGGPVDADHRRGGQEPADHRLRGAAALSGAHRAHGDGVFRQRRHLLRILQGRGAEAVADPGTDDPQRLRVDGGAAGSGAQRRGPDRQVPVYPRRRLGPGGARDGRTGNPAFLLRQGAAAPESAPPGYHPVLGPQRAAAGTPARGSSAAAGSGLVGQLVGEVDPAPGSAGPRAGLLVPLQFLLLCRLRRCHGQGADNNDPGQVHSDPSQRCDEDPGAGDARCAGIRLERRRGHYPGGGQR